MSHECTCRNCVLDIEACGFTRRRWCLGRLSGLRDPHEHEVIMTPFQATVAFERDEHGVLHVLITNGYGQAMRAAVVTPFEIREADAPQAD